MYRRYYSYSDMPQLIKKESEPEHKPKEDTKKTSQADCPQKNGGLFGGGNIFEEGKLFGKFELDDIILAIVVAALLFDDCDDNLLLIALGFIFLTGIV